VKPIVTGDPQVFHAGLANAPILRVLAASPLRLAARRPEPVRATGVTIVPGRGVRVIREQA
jgi:hypothetical protein